MEEQLFKVVFDGSLTGEFDEDTTRQKFQKLFGLDKRRTDMLFSGREYIIKNKVPENVAMKFLIRLAEIGCECYIQEIPGEDEVVPENDRRKSGERRLRFRRGARPGAILPDRRLKIRRKRDRRHFVDIKKNQREMPLAFRSYNDDAIKD